MSVFEAKIKGFLSPVERFSEILFGLIMTLSIMGTLSVVSGGREEVFTTILSVLGCNLAWGIIDAVLYLLGTVSDRGRGYTSYDFIRKTTDLQKARTLIAESLPPVVADSITPEEVEGIRLRITRLPEITRPRLMSKQDLGGAFGVFTMVLLSCVPLIIPFLIFQDQWIAHRASNAVAILMLYAGGHMLAKYAGLPRVWTGVVMVTLGVLMVGLTIALGG